MRKIEGFTKGMGIGGWLTNYKRFNVLPPEWRMKLTIGDMEHFDTYITDWDVANIKNMGLDHVRVGFDQIVLEESPYVYREHIFELLEHFVECCEKNGLGVVLNMHKSLGNYCDIEEEVTLFDSEDYQNRFIALWVELEKRFSGHKDVMFELLNEVRDVDPRLWNQLAERTVDAIREESGGRKIIVGSTDWNDCNELDKLKIFDDENVIYTFHMYAPYEFTHQRAVLHAKALYYNRKMAYPGDIQPYREYRELIDGDPDAYAGFERMDLDYIRYRMGGAARFVKEHPDKILWCGEFSALRHIDIRYRENWMRDVITVLKENDIPYCVWNYLSMPNDGTRCSLVDDDTRKILSSNMLKTINGEVG